VLGHGKRDVKPSHKVFTKFTFFTGKVSRTSDTEGERLDLVADRSTRGYFKLETEYT